MDTSDLHGRVFGELVHSQNSVPEVKIQLIEFIFKQICQMVQ